MEQVYDIVKLSSIPIMLAKIMTVAESPDSSREELVKVIEHDQTLAARVLEMANTACYGSPRKIMTLNSAVSLMGFEAIKELAVTGTIFRDLSKNSGDKVTEFWRHSFEVAKTSVCIANMTGLIRPDATFLAGLLHDIGRPILYQIYKDDYIGALASSSDHIKDEEELFGASHADVGSWFADKCSFPEELIMAIRLHHIPGSHVLDPNSYLLPVVYLADYVVSEDGDGYWTDLINSPDHEKILKILGVNKDGMERLHDEVKEVQEHTASYYK